MEKHGLCPFFVDIWKKVSTLAGKDTAIIVSNAEKIFKIVF
jgi:hypothetical protein